MLSLWYLAGVPYQVYPHTLETIGAEDFGGKLRRKLSAHSKVDPHTGELIFFTDWVYQGDTQMALYESVEFQTNDQFEGGVRITYFNEAGYEVSVVGRNITNEDNIKGFIDFNNNTGFVNEPEYWGGEFRVQF